MHGELEGTMGNEPITQQNSRAMNESASGQVYHINITPFSQQDSRAFEEIVEVSPAPYGTALHQSPSNTSCIKQLKSIDSEMIENASLKHQSTPFQPDHRWPRFSTNAVCPHCGTTSYTRVETASTNLTFALAIVLCLLCCCLFFIPFCLPSCKKTTHYCSNCSAMLGEVDAFQ
ncbi:hypothetical protein I4U23_007104 [Adineta vaga]|nr:hypothetical protein I4U23_007104 [Adineta vaga]